MQLATTAAWLLQSRHLAFSRRSLTRRHAATPFRPRKQAGGRRLLSDCTVVGSVGVGGSIAILLLIGFVVGAASSAVFFWWRQRRAMRIEVRSPSFLAPSTQQLSLILRRPLTS